MTVTIHKPAVSAAMLNENRIVPVEESDPNQVSFSLFGSNLNGCFERVQVLKELTDDMDYSTDEINGIAIMRLGGRVDAHTAEPLANWLNTQSAPMLLINFEAATFIDTYAISLLIKGLKRCNEEGSRLVLCNLAQPVQIIFELMRLDRAFQVFEDEASAVESLATIA